MGDHDLWQMEDKHVIEHDNLSNQWLCDVKGLSETTNVLSGRLSELLEDFGCRGDNTIHVIQRQADLMKCQNHHRTGTSHLHEVHCSGQSDQPTEVLPQQVCMR